jgi:hypothetical protein
MSHEAALKAWRTRRINYSEEEWKEYMHNVLREEEENEKKQIRSTIINIGGIDDKDYEYIPIWAKRKGGRQLDDIAIELNHEYPWIENADAVYRLILEATG